LIEKTQKPNYINWFFQPRSDGFTSGRNRQPDPEHNDLPLITAAIRSREEIQAVVPLDITDQGPAGYRVLFTNENSHFRVNRLSRLNARETCYLVDVSSGSENSFYWINQSEIQPIDGQTQPIKFSLPEKYTREINATFLQGVYSIQLTDEGGEICGERKNSYPLQIVKQWDDSSWMGIVLNADGSPAGPAFILNEVPNRFKEADDTVFPWDIEIPFDSNGEETAFQDEKSGTLILFPPDKLEGLKLTEQDYLIKSEKHYWLRIHLEKNNSAQFEIFFHESSSSIFESDGRQSGAVFTREGEVLGVAVPSHIIQKTVNLDLQPTTYFPRQHETSEAGLESPAQILADIQKSQLELSGQIGKLLALAEMKPAANESIPPHQVNISPMGELRSIQKTVWDVLQTMVEEHESIFTPRPFQVSDIDTEIRENLQNAFMKQVDPDRNDNEAGLEPYTEQDMLNFVSGNSYSEPDLMRVLDLFERMGVVVRVLIDGSEYYRLSSERELLGGTLQ